MSSYVLCQIHKNLSSFISSRFLRITSGDERLILHLMYLNYVFANSVVFLTYEIGNLRNSFVMLDTHCVSGRASLWNVLAGTGADEPFLLCYNVLERLDLQFLQL